MSDKKLLTKAVIFGTTCGLLISVIFMCILAVIMLSIGIFPIDLTNYVCIAVLAIGTFCGGIITTKITKSAGLIVGLFTGLSVFLLITIFGLIKSNDSITMHTLIKFVTSIIFGSFGGIVGLRKKEKLHIK